jgi:uncharacterized protein (DUF2147 family)
MQRILGLILAACLLLAGPAAAGTLSGIAGSWRTVRYEANVGITDCGDGSPCGYLLSSGLKQGEGRTSDSRNPDAALRDRPLDGLPLLWGFSPAGAGWEGGRLYNPETGQTFRSSMQLISADRLRVRGCLGLLCRSQVWTRIGTPGTTSMKGSSDE